MSGELVTPLEDRLRAAVQGWVDHGRQIVALVTEARDTRRWEVTGHENLHAWLVDVVGQVRGLHREDRDSLARVLVGAGLTARATASVLGVHHRTVQRAITATRDLGANAPEAKTPKAEWEDRLAERIVAAGDSVRAQRTAKRIALGEFWVALTENRVTSFNTAPRMSARDIPPVPSKREDLGPWLDAYRAWGAQLEAFALTHALFLLWFAILGDHATGRGRRNPDWEFWPLIDDLRENVYPDLVESGLLLPFGEFEDGEDPVLTPDLLIVAEAWGRASGSKR